MINKEDVKKIVKEKYEEIAKSKTSCGCHCSNNTGKISKEIGYSNEDIKTVGTANLGLGCGNPVAISKIKEGDTVLDLGSGAGIDCILASKKVGDHGKVIGVDMTEEMVEKARENAKKMNLRNIEYVVGEIENLPIEDNSIDVIITNCVINLSPDKDKTFKEAYRVLKSGGKMYISDIVLLEELSEGQRNNPELLSGCVAGALLKDEYLKKIRNVGFSVNILGENKEISKTQYQGIPLESMSVEVIK